ncbi:MAG: ribosome-binding factor A [Paludibacteraceae bacterium]|nr:ribosome-binding factor A [Paludibacteraceae bacterium]
MQSTRQQKIERLIQKDLGDIFNRFAKRAGNALGTGLLISVSEVRISPDLSIAHSYLSIFPSDKAEAVLAMIKEEQKTIRFELGNLERNQLRIIPELNFHIDTTLDHMEVIDSLLKQ